MVDQKLSADVEKQVTQLSQWIDQQPELPHNIDKKLVLRFLHSCYYDMEKARATAQLFFNIRTSAPELICNRDPLSPHMKRIMSAVNIAQFRISGNRNLWVWQINDPTLDLYDYTLDAKMMILSTDGWILEDDFLEESDIVLLDVKDISLKFLTKLNLSVAKKLSKYEEDAMPIRLKGIHIVNTPPILDKIYAIMKPLLKKETTNMINFHTPNSPTLFDHIQKEDLPADFGGTREKMADLMPRSIALMNKHRQTVLDDNFWRCDKKEKNKTNSTEVGAFRTLDID